MNAGQRRAVYLVAGAAALGAVGWLIYSSLNPSDARAEPPPAPGAPVPPPREAPRGRIGQQVVTQAPCTLRSAAIAAAIGPTLPTGTHLTIRSVTETTRGASRLHGVEVAQATRSQQGWCFLNAAELAGG